MKIHETIHNLIYNEEKRICCINRKIYLNVISKLENPKDDGNHVDYVFSIIKFKVKKLLPASN
jgi:hypothetical protein